MIFDVFLFSLFYRPLYSPPNFLVVSYVSLFLDPLPRGGGVVARFKVVLGFGFVSLLDEDSAYVMIV
jgi:hypothetical protein